MKIIFVFVLLIWSCRTTDGVKKNTKEVPDLIIEPMTYEPDLNYITPGLRRLITCTGTTQDQKIEWVDPNEKVINRISSNRVFVQEMFTRRGSRNLAQAVVITKTDVDDTGVYTCRSEGITQSVTLCVIDPSRFVNTSTEVSVDMGRSITLSCQAQGLPEPRLVWYRNGQSITDDDSTSKYRVMTKYNSQGFEGLLTVTNVAPEDSGVYTCESIQESSRVDDCVHIDRINIMLQVHYRPIFQDTNSTKYVFTKGNHSVELLCAANAHPSPRYKWFRDVGDNTLSEYPQRQIKVADDGSYTKLTMLASPSIFGSRYICRASNVYGEVDKTYVVLKVVKPEKPDMVGVTNATHDTVYLTFSWYDEFMFKVDDVDIQYLQALSRDTFKKIVEPNKRSWKKADLITVPLHDVYGHGGWVIQLPDLEENTQYWVRLRAKNEAGDSPWSDSVLACTVEMETTSEVAETAEIVEYAAETTTQIIDEVEEVSDVTFYGIFFFGCIFIVICLCMFAMKRV